MSNDTVKFDVLSDVESATVKVDGFGRISWAGENERPLVNSMVRYCFLEECLCPDDRPPWDGAPYEQIGRGTAWLGLGGHSIELTSVEVDGLTQDEVCEPCEGEGGGGFRQPGGGGFGSPAEDCPDPCLSGKWRQDTATMESEFRRLMAGQPVESVSIEGDNVVEFAGHAVTVTWGTTITAVIPSDEVITLTFIETFAGEYTGTYNAVEPNLFVETVGSTLTTTVITYVNGTPTAPSTQSPDPFGGSEITYECEGNQLIMHPERSTVTHIFERINPTE